MMYNKQNSYQFHKWHISSAKGRILASQGPSREHYERQLPHLPHLPDMLFADNRLRLVYNHVPNNSSEIANAIDNSFGIEFNALDALKLVQDAKTDLIKVSVAKEWKESRQDCEFIDKMVHPFDWTFTTSYKGTLIGNNEELKLKPSATDERINLDKLRVQETITFFEEISLFDDELSDHGVANLNVKIRCMPTSFYILQRFFLRVDNVVARINDTRIYHELDKPYLLREYTERESLIKDLAGVPPRILTEPNELAAHLELKKSLLEKLEFPSLSGSS